MEAKSKYLSIEELFSYFDTHIPNDQLNLPTLHMETV